MNTFLSRTGLLIVLLIGLTQLAGTAGADQASIAGTHSTGPAQISGYAKDRYSKLPINTSNNSYYKKQASYTATPGHDPRKPGYSDIGTNEAPGRNPTYDRKYDHEARLRAMAEDPKIGRAPRGEIKQEIHRVDLNRSRTLPKHLRSGSDIVRNPSGFDLAHAPGLENHKGYGFAHAQLQNSDLHRLQHTGKLDHTWQYERDMNNPNVGGDHWGRRNKERIPAEYQTRPST